MSKPLAARLRSRDEGLESVVAIDAEHHDFTRTVSSSTAAGS
jgi:hypothetical protein